MNPERVSVLDVDFDIEGRKRPNVLNKFREFYGEDRVSNVTTFRTESSKLAVLTAARGLGINNDIAQNIASLIVSDRGKTRTLKETYYGDPDKDFQPNLAFVHEMRDNYPELWEVAQRIEGLICGSGIHAGGVIFVDEPFTNSTALMRAPDGTICTQFDLHDCEDVSLIKYDALSVEAMDKIHICLDLLCKYEKVQPEATLKETYEKILGIYNIEREDPKMWEMVWNHSILSLFQMEQQSGIQGIALAKPKSVNDLSVLNSVIRLMAPDKNSETPLETWSKYRKDITIWYREMEQYGLSKEEIKWLAHHSAITNGICESQEGLMSLVQEPQLGGNSLTFADKCRKGIAKKQGKLFQECEDVYFENIKKNNCSEKLAHYVWDVLLKVQRGYSFNRSHCLAYSLVALQEMNLAFHFPIVFWNCACLISDSGSFEAVTDEENKDKGVDYAKVATAISEIISRGIKVSLININESGASFEPDEKNNRILYGLKALGSVNSEIIEKIEAGRPYAGIKDFMNKCSLGKIAMVNLIKSGAFDEVDTDLDNRQLIMAYYISKICEPKKKLNLQNWNGLVQKGLVPESLELQIRIYNFTKYLKANCKVGKYYQFNDICMKFLEKFMPEVLDQVLTLNGAFCMLQGTWDKIYQNGMDPAREWLKEYQEDILRQYNRILFKEMWEKYASGSVSKWEMDSVCFYYSPHELSEVNNQLYGISNFENIVNKEVERYWKRDGKEIPIFKLSKIAGTVIGKNDNRHTATLLTTTGVVTITLSKEQYAKYKKQISKINPDGTKSVVEKSWFTRGTMLLVTGYRRDNQFVVKTYASSNTHQLYKITQVNGERIQLQHERIQVGANEIEEDVI